MSEEVIQNPQEQAETGNDQELQPQTDQNIKRDETGKLLPGTKSLNPGGRPKGFSITAILREKLKQVAPGYEQTYLEMFVEKMLQQAVILGDFQTCKLLMNYIDGMPKQSVEHSGEINSYTAAVRGILTETDQQINDDENAAFNDEAASGLDGTRPVHSEQAAPAPAVDAQSNPTPPALPTPPAA